MGYLKIVAVLLVLPPVNLLLFAVVGLFLARYRPRIGWIVTTVSVAGLVLLSMHAVTTPMLSALERNLPMQPPADAPPAAIVVLSGDSLASPSVPGGFTVGGLTLRRLQTAASLHRKTGLPILVTGGSVPRHAPALADLMAQSLRVDFRVETRWQERKSLDTWENARFTAEVLKDAGVSSIYLVTDAWHMRRALLAFEQTGLRVTAAPNPLQRPLSLTVTDFIPTVSSWTVAYFALHEWIGLVWYSIRPT